MSAYDHIHPDFQHILGLSDAERREFLDQPRWIGYPGAHRILESLTGLIHKPRRPRMPNVLIVGEPNNGKTTIVHRFNEVSGKSYVNDDAEAVKPVILTEAPPSADEKGLYISILERFFAPYRATDPATKLRYQVIHLCRSCHVSMLIIDEFHSMLTGPTQKQREVMNALKLLCNELAIPIVGAGTRDAIRVLHTDPQHASRFDVMTLPLWQKNKDFQRLLAGFEKVLPLKQCSRLYEPEVAAKLHAISGGNLGDLHRLLTECALEAIETGEERITPNLIDKKKWIRPTRGIREVTA